MSPNHRAPLALTIVALLSLLQYGCGNAPTGTATATVSGVPLDANDVSPLLPGMTAPAFTATAADGRPFRFDPTRLDKPVVISFYRGGWCPYCNRQLAELRKAEKQLSGMGFELLFLSADRAELLEPSLKEKDLGYTLLSDHSMAVAREFGVAFVVDEATRTRYTEHGIDLEEASGMDHHQLPVPATFLVGTDGTIYFQYANPNYKVRLDPDLLVAAAKVYSVNAAVR